MKVSRAAELTSTSLVLGLPGHLSIPLLDILVKNDQFPDMLIAIKLLDKVLEVQKVQQVKTHLKEIMLGLLKVEMCFKGNILKTILSQAYDNVESSVRKASVNCMVTLHGLVGDSALQPHLYCLSGPKRKLLSLYIMRHRQKMVSCVT